MGLFIKRESETQSVPVFVTILEDFPGGGTLDVTGLDAGATIKAGAIVSFDESTRLVSVVKTARVTEAAGATATAYRVGKGSLVKVGDKIAAKTGGKSYAVTAINTSNANYDELTVGTSIGAVAAGDGVFVSSGDGATAGAFAGAVNGVLRNDVVVGVNEGVAVVRRGTVYNRRLPYPAPQAVKDEMKGLMVFSEQF